VNKSADFRVITQKREGRIVNYTKGKEACQDTLRKVIDKLFEKWYGRYTNTPLQICHVTVFAFTHGQSPWNSALRNVVDKLCVE